MFLYFNLLYIKKKDLEVFNVFAHAYKAGGRLVFFKVNLNKLYVKIIADYLFLKEELNLQIKNF